MLTPDAGGARTRAEHLTPQATAAVSRATSALREHCAKLLADYKCPRTYEVLPLDELPMTGSNKIAKAELRKTDAERRKGGAALATSSSKTVVNAEKAEVSWERH